MPSILDNFKPVEYTPTTIQPDIAQTAKIFDNWNQRYLQNREQADLVTQALNQIKVKDADKAHLANAATDIRNTLSGDDYAMMAPKIHQAYQSLANNMQIKAAVTNSQALDAAETEARDRYSKGLSSQTQYANDLTKIRSYQGVGHYENGQYLAGAPDQYGYYDTVKPTVSQVNRVDLDARLNDVMSKYKGNINATSTQSSIIGPNGIPNPRISTVQNSIQDKQKARDMVAISFLSDPNSSAYINDEIRIQYENAGLPMPSGKDLDKARLSYIKPYMDRTAGDIGDTHEVSSQDNPNYDKFLMSRPKEDKVVVGELPSYDKEYSAPEYIKNAPSIDSATKFVSDKSMPITSISGQGGDLGATKKIPLSPSEKINSVSSWWNNLSTNQKALWNGAASKYSNYKDVVDSHGNPRLGRILAVQGILEINQHINANATPVSGSNPIKFRTKILSPTDEAGKKELADFNEGIQNIYPTRSFYDPATNTTYPAGTLKLAGPTDIRVTGYPSSDNNYGDTSGDANMGVGTTVLVKPVGSKEFVPMIMAANQAEVNGNPKLRSRRREVDINKLVINSGLPSQIIDYIPQPDGTVKPVTASRIPGTNGIALMYDGKPLAIPGKDGTPIPIQDLNPSSETGSNLEYAYKQLRNSSNK